MKKPKIQKFYIFSTAILLMISAAALFFSDMVSKAENKTEPSKFALLVGINNYHSDTVQDLRGTHNDVELMKSLLSEYGFQEEKTGEKDRPCGGQTAKSALQTLCSEQATKKAILDTFDRHLIENAKNFQTKNKTKPEQGAQIVFYYSGHGSTLPDDNGDEADGIDETLVPTDSDIQGINDIRDDEFAGRMAILRRYTTNITFIADSCHSGTITRGSGQKSVPREFETAKNSRGNFPLVLNDGFLGSDDYVTISGSLPNEKSQEDYFTDRETQKEKLNGVLTYFLVNLLRQYPNSTYREIMNRVRNAVVSLKKDQTPQAEGDLDRTVFGAAGQKGQVPIFPVCTKEKGKMNCSKMIEKNGQQIHRIKIKVGEIIGARAGGAVAVYAPPAKVLAGENDRIGSGTIISSTQFTAEAEVVLTNNTLKKFPENAKIVLVSPNFTDEKRIVALDLTGDPSSKSAEKKIDAGTGKIKELNTILQSSDYLKPLETANLLARLAENTGREKWDIAVVRATYQDFLLGNRQPILKDPPKKNEEGYFLSSRSGKPLYNFWISADAPALAAEIRDALEKHVRLENLRALGNEASGIGERLKVELVRVKDFEVVDEDAPACKITPVDEIQRRKDNLGTPQMRAGDKFYLQISNTSDKDLYIYIYSLGTDGKINLLYPPAGADEMLKKGNMVKTSGSNECRVFYIPPEDSPFGRETIKVIAAAEPFPAEMLTSPAIAKNVTARNGSPLVKLLKQAATNSRSGQISNTGIDSWGAVNFDFEIVP